MYRKRVTAVDINRACTQIAVGNCVGEAMVINSKSGGIIYNLPGVETELTMVRYLSSQSEYWIVGACWQGQLVFWTKPNEQNNYQINAVVRIGHRGDVFTIDCQQSYIVSGGVDGLVSVWNQFSGVMKYAIKLPEPKRDERVPKSSLMSPKGNSIMQMIQDKDDQSAIRKASGQIRKAIINAFFHPYYKNVAIVLQEGGNVHAVDVSNGQVVVEDICHVWPNSCWAVDEECYKVLVVGEDGRATLFDMRMGAPKNEELVEQLT